MAPKLQPFDPYHKWLGIPREEQPPTHYRLLGIRPFESDPDVIEAAAEQRMAHLRSRQAGQHAAFSQQLLNQIAAARLELLIPERKREYDRNLHQKLRAEAAVIPVAEALPKAMPVAPVDPPFLPAPHAPVVTTARRPLPRRRRNALGPTLLLGSTLALAALIGGIVWWPSIKRELAGQQQPPRKARSTDSTSPLEPVPSTSNKVPLEDNPRHPKPAPTAVAQKPSAKRKAAPARVHEPVPRNEAVPEDEAPTPDAAEEKRPPVAVDSEPMRTPVPVEEELEQARAALRNIYKEDLAAAKGPQQKTQLASRLLQEGLTMEDDSAGRYALFEAARELTEAAGDPRMALRACDQLARYDVETLRIKRQSLESCGKQAKKPNDWRQLSSAAVEVLEQAVAADDYPAAQELLTTAKQFARKARESDLLADLDTKATELTAAASAYEEAKAALSRVETDANDAESHLVAGKYLGFFKGDWPQAMRHLSQGSDESLAELADRERERSFDPTSWLELGDAWSEQAAAAEAAERIHYQRRAVYWYRQALPSLSGLARARLEQKLKALPAEESTISHAAPKASSAPWQPLAGIWRVSYSNGVERQYEIDALGNVALDRGLQRGSLELRGNDVVLDFGDGKLERWVLNTGGLVVEHYDDARMYPGRASISGRGLKIASASKKSIRR